MIGPAGRTTDPVKGIASIEVGTHTARLLFARPTDDGSLIEPVFRERRTIRLAEGFGPRGTGPIRREAFQRTAEAIRDFGRRVGEANGEIVQAVSTGVTRTASNRNAFLQRVLDDSGVRIRSISGEEEAELTARGVLHALGPFAGPFLLFDLGGGTTEFILGGESCRSATAVRSLPLGALVLKEAFLHDDPPSAASLEALAGRIQDVLAEGLSDLLRASSSPPRLIGTGGTVTTLAAMAHDIEVFDIRPERMNGLRLSMQTLRALYERMVGIPAAQRAALRGLDAGRADVIPAGTLAVMQTIQHVGAEALSVCLSDILEGLLITYLEGKRDE